jgi:hypothetical protein
MVVLVGRMSGGFLAASIIEMYLLAYFPVFR